MKKLHISKRITALALSLIMVLGLMPVLPMTANTATTTALAASTPSVVVGGVEMYSDSGTTYYVNGATAAVSTEPAVWNAKYEGGTLTIKNLLVMGTASSQYAGIYAEDIDLTIDIQGANSVTGGDNTDSSYGDRYGIYVGDNLTFQGDGALSVTGGVGENSYGIYCDGVLIINGGTISATSDTDSRRSYGIYSKGKLTINGGTVAATGGEADQDSGYAIFGTSVYFSGGVVVARRTVASTETAILAYSLTHTGIKIAGGDINEDAVVIVPNTWENGSSLDFSTNYADLTTNYYIVNYNENALSLNGDIEIRTNGNTLLAVSLYRDGNSSSSGINTGGYTLNVNGNGELIAVGADSSSGSYGINGNICIYNEASVTAISGRGTRYNSSVYGIREAIVDNGTVNAIGDMCGSNSSGLSQVTIESGTVNAIGGTYGISGSTTVTGGMLNAVGGTYGLDTGYGSIAAGSFAGGTAAINCSGSRVTDLLALGYSYYVNGEAQWPDGSTVGGAYESVTIDYTVKPASEVFRNYDESKWFNADNAPGFTTQNGWFVSKTALVGGVTTVTYSTEGQNLSETVYVKDGAGTVYRVKIQYSYDRTAPTIGNISGNPTDWTKDDAVISFTAADSLSGVASVDVTCDDGRYVTYTNSRFTADRNGTYTITVTDNAGNAATETVVVEKIDKTAPVISNVELPDITGDWHTSNPTVTVTATESESGFATEAYSFDGGTTWQSENSKQFENGTHTVAVCVKDAVGNIAMRDAIILKVDTVAPGGDIKVVGRTYWETLLNKITFGLFFKGDATATIAAEDEESGVKTIDYFVADKDLIDNDTLNSTGALEKLNEVIGDGWLPYNGEFTLNDNAKNVIYAKITDNVGNVTYLSSDGFVLYTDAEAVTENVSINYKAGKDQEVAVKLNGNTVNTIKNGEDALTEGTDYTVSNDGTITLKADYLDTLNVGSYSFTVSYNPLGEIYVEAAGNDAPLTTAFTVRVSRNITGATVTVVGSFTYDGSAKTPEPIVALDGVTLVKDRDYSVAYSNNINAGDATVTVTGMGDYIGTASKVFAIDPVPITVTADDKSKTYGENDPALTWSITSGALVNGEQLTDINLYRASGEAVLSYWIIIEQEEGANKNYNISFEYGKFTIHAKTVDASVLVNGAPFTYNGSKQEPEIVVKDGDTVIPATEYEVSYSNNTNAGTATVTVTDKDGGNYVVNGSTTFIINKADPVIGTVGVDGIVKDSTNPSEVNLTRTDTTVDGVLKLADDAMLANKSTYRWVFTPADTDNYNVINGDVQIDVLDTVLPTAVIKVDTNEWKQFINNITFGLFFKETQAVTITAADNENGSGIKEIVYFVSDREYEADELRYVEWKSYTEAFEIEPDGKFVIYAKVTDNDGNAAIVNSDGVVVDKTAAVVSGITDGGTYYGLIAFTVADDLAGVKEVNIDGTPTVATDGSYTITADNAEHTVVVTDNAGNVTEYKVTVYKNYTVTYKADGEPISTETVGHGKDATAPAVPAKEGYVGKWDSDGKNITEDTTINVIYTEIPVVKPDEVKPEDKTDLEDTKAKLEEELKDDSYTDDDKKNIQDAIDDIDDALEVIGNVEAVEDLIDKLPDTIKKDDEAAIKAADDAYNVLTDYEKSLVDEDTKKALDDAKMALAELNKSADPDSPQTGDNSNMFLWIALLFISGGAVITLTVVDRKRRTAKR